MLLDLPVTRRRHIGLTPLIDVVFLLLLFFMLASSFEQFAEIELQAATAGTADPLAGKPVFIRLHDDGRLDVDATDTPLADLQANLNTLVSEGRAAAVVQVRNGVPTQRLVDVLEQIRRSEIRSMVLSR